MIPKKIHYCWFGGVPLPPNVIECINSWKKFFPDYEIKEWNENNFDLSCCAYVEEAYSCKKWAFVSDYARFKILYEEGGIYFDTDVEVISSYDDILGKGSFMGKEANVCPNLTLAPNTEEDSEDGLVVNPGLGLSAVPGLELYKEIIAYYNSIHFDKENIITVCAHVTNILKKHGYVGNNSIEEISDIIIYPPEYFCPLDYKTGIFTKTDNTHSIHWYTASWNNAIERIIARIETCAKDKESLEWKVRRFASLPFRVINRVRSSGIKGAKVAIVKSLKKQ